MKIKNSKSTKIFVRLFFFFIYFLISHLFLKKNYILYFSNEPDMQRDELISDVILWTPTYSRAKAGWPDPGMKPVLSNHWQTLKRGIKSDICFNYIEANDLLQLVNQTFFRRWFDICICVWWERESQDKAIYMNSGVLYPPVQYLLL